MQPDEIGKMGRKRNPYRARGPFLTGKLKLARQ